MVKNILGLLIGLSILGYGGCHSIKFASLSKSKPLFETKSNIDLVEEVWTKPVTSTPSLPVAPAPAPSTPAAPKGKAKKKAKKAQTKATCELNTGISGRRIKVESSGTLTCGSGKGK